MLLRVIDIETTGTEPPAEIIEIGRVDVISDGDGWRIDRPMARLYRPLNDIPPETMAVHHITEDDFDSDTPVCSKELMRKAIWGGERPDILVAHNCAFEQMFITEDATDELPWICTYKVALHVWPDAPRHTNQVLRYWRGLKLDAALAMPPHRAGPDAWVTAHLLTELHKESNIEQMVEWTKQPKHMPTIPFGKHEGSSWQDIPSDYLSWMIRQDDMDSDAIWYAQKELERQKSS
jgi:exodeoxyribonuclease X